MRVLVTDLPLVEPARFNPNQLERLCNEIGEQRAEAEVERALDRIAMHLRKIARGLDTQADAHLDPKVLGSVQKVARDAGHIGMTTLSRVAGDVLSCAANRDDTACAATLARLRRVGDRSIHAVWDLDDSVM